MKTIYCDIEIGMTREQYLSKCDIPREDCYAVEVCFDSERDLEEFDKQCMCFAIKKHPNVHRTNSYSFIEYDFDDFEELERNISYLVNSCGWKLHGLL